MVAGHGGRVLRAGHVHPVMAGAEGYGDAVPLFTTDVSAPVTVTVCVPLSSM